MPNEENLIMAISFEEESLLDQSTPAHAPRSPSDSDGSTAASGETAEKISEPQSEELVSAHLTNSYTTSRQEPVVVEVPFGEFDFILCRSQDGTAYAVFIQNGKNASAIPVKSEQFAGYLTQLIYERDREINTFKNKELIERMAFYATHYGKLVHVWNRVAKIESGIEIALNDDDDTRVRITGARVELLEQGSDTIFHKRQLALPMPRPSKSPNLKLLDRYLNVSDKEILLLQLWITYTICSPKNKGVKYVFLVVQGDQGSGKSLLCRILQSIIDPSALEMQSFPSNPKDLALILSIFHLVSLDNMRSFNATTSDMLCIASTGGNISSRALYTNDTLHVLQLHGAIIFNSIHSFVLQSDLAQRCMTIRTKAIDGDVRVPEAQLLKEFERDLPDILAGLYELSSNIMAQLPNAVVTHPERMIEFCHWIAAAEIALDIPQGVAQQAYREILNESQLETLLENQLASAVIKFISEHHRDTWSGTPSQLLYELEASQQPRSLYGIQWPQNPIQLSKRLTALKASLAAQGIIIELIRSKERKISITKTNDSFNTLY